jgi:hypothetical protein
LSGAGAATISARHGALVHLCIDFSYAFDVHTYWYLLLYPFTSHLSLAQVFAGLQQGQYLPCVIIVAQRYPARLEPVPNHRL